MLGINVISSLNSCSSVLHIFYNLLHADLPSENNTSGYIFIHAEGGLNQQRIAVSFLNWINFIIVGIVVC